MMQTIPDMADIELDKNKQKDEEDALKKASEEEEDILVNDFKERLSYNMLKEEKGISQSTSRHRRAKKRPDDGWTYIIKPLGSKGHLKIPSFAGKPDGTRRNLTEAEEMFERRKTPRRRRRID